MKNFLVLLLVTLLATPAFATRTLVGDQVVSSDYTKTYLFPPASSTLLNSTMSNLTNPTALNQDLNLVTHNVLGVGNLNIGDPGVPAHAMNVNGFAQFGSEPGVKLMLDGGDIGVNRDTATGAVNPSSFGYQLHLTQDTSAPTTNIAWQVYNSSGSLVTNHAFSVTGQGFVGVNTNTPANPLDVNGVMGMNGNKIVSLGTPTVATDAATKGYVDGVGTAQTLSQVLTHGNNGGGTSIQNVPTLNDATNVVAVDVANRKLFQTDGTTLALDWGTTPGVVHVPGKLTVDGVVDPTQVLLTGPNKRFGATDAGAVYLAPFADQVAAVEVRKADDTTSVLSVDTTDGQVFINSSTTQHGSNTGFQVNSIVANRGAMRANQYGANTGVPGITGFKSRGATVGSTLAVVDGDALFRATAIGVTGNNTNVPNSAFETIQVATGGVFPTYVASEYELQLTNLAGTRARKWFVGSEGNATLSGTLQAAAPVVGADATNKTYVDINLNGTHASPVDVSALTTIPFLGSFQRNKTYISSTAPVTMSGTPEIAAGTVDGQELLIENAGSQNITIPGASGDDLNGPITLVPNDQIELSWNGTVWNEIARKQ